MFAVTGMPERTTAPKETAHYILFSGNKKNKRYKMKINTCEFENIDGKVNRLKVVSAIPNFEEVKGIELKEMYDKCCPAFKRAFPL